MPGRVLGLLVVLAALSACASTEQQIEAASQIDPVDDKFAPYREYSSGFVRGKTVKGLERTMLTARIDRKTSALTTALVYEAAYEDGHRYDYIEARNARAEILPMQSFFKNGKHCRRSEGTCVYTEALTVTIPDSELRQAPADGYQVKLFAKHGRDALVTIPKPIITSLLAKADADKSGAPAASSSPAKPVASAAH